MARVPVLGPPHPDSLTDKGSIFLGLLFVFAEHIFSPNVILF